MSDLGCLYVTSSSACPMNDCEDLIHFIASLIPCLFILAFWPLLRPVFLSIVYNVVLIIHLISSR